MHKARMITLSMGMVLGSFVAVPCDAAGVPGTSFFIEDWHGSAYTSDTNHEFSHCAAIRLFPGKPTFIVSKTVNGTWGLGLADNGWHLSNGTKYPVKIAIDKLWETSGDAISVTEGQVEFYHNNIDFMRAFQAGQTIFITTASASWSFSLKGTYRLIQAIENCVSSATGSGGAVTANSTNPFVSSPKPNPFATSQAGYRNPLGATQNPKAPIPVFFSVPARFLPQATLQSIFQEASIADLSGMTAGPAEFPGAAYSWKVRNAIVGVAYEIDPQRYKETGQDIDAIFSQFLGGMGGTCKGTWASGVKPSENPRIKRAFGACRGSNASLSYFMSGTSISLPTAYELIIHVEPGDTPQFGAQIDDQLAAVLARRATR